MAPTNSADEELRGRAYEVPRAFTVTISVPYKNYSMKYELTLKRGDRGRVNQALSARGLLEISLPPDRRPSGYPKELTTAWVRQNCVEIGSGVVGAYSLRFQASTPSSIPLSLQEGGRTYRTMMQFFTDLKANKDCAVLMKAVLTTLDIHGLRNYCQAITAAIARSNLLDLLDGNTNVTLRDITRLAVNYTPQLQRSGKGPPVIYMWVLETSDRTGLYTGQALDARARGKNHISDARPGGKKYPVYRCWRRSISQNNYILSDFTGIELNNYPGILDFAELFWTAVGLQTYQSWVIDESHQAIVDGNAIDVDLDDNGSMIEAADVHTDDIITAGSHHPSVQGLLNASTEPDASHRGQSNVAPRHLRLRQPACLVSSIARSVRSLLQWRVTSASAEFGNVYGLNLSTPLSLLEDTDKLVITHIEIPNTMDIFIRRPLIVARNTKQAYVGMRIGQRVVGLGIPTGQPPAIGTRCFVVCEIMKPSRGAHPYPYTRLPKLPQTDDWESARALGIAMVWRSTDGKWCKRYVQASMLNDNVGGSRAPSKSYCQTKSLIHALYEQRTADVNWDGGLFNPAWIDIFADTPLIIQTLSFDWLSQTLSRITSTKGLSRIWTPRQIGVTARTQLLVNAGAQRLGIPHGTYKRSRCDYCFLRLQRCIKHGDTEDCTNCVAFNIHSTWTTPPSEEYKALVLPETEKENTYMEIEDPEVG